MSKNTPDSIGKTIEDMVHSGECEVEFDKNNNIKKIKITNIGHNKGKSATISDINKYISDGLILGRERKRYRKREELPDPSKPANDPVNLRRKPVTLRCEPELTDAMNRAASLDGVIRNDWINTAIVEKLKRDHPELLSTSQDGAEPDVT